MFVIIGTLIYTICGSWQRETHESFRSSTRGEVRGGVSEISETVMKYLDDGYGSG